MQITLNKVPFDVAPVEAPLRAALMAQPEVAPARARRVAAVDAAGKPRLLVDAVPGQGPGAGVPISPGLAVFVARTGAAGGTPERADGPTRRMAERLREAVGAQTLTQVMGGMARVLGVPRVVVPAIKGLEGRGSYLVRMDVDYAVVSLTNGSRNLVAYAFMPAAAIFGHLWATLDDKGAEIRGEAPEGAPASGAQRQVVLLTPTSEAATAIRRLALGQRLRELQADLGGVPPAELDPTDRRRAQAAWLGAEARLLQPRPPAPPKPPAPAPAVA